MMRCSFNKRMAAAGLSSTIRNGWAAIQTVCGISAAHLPMLIFSAGEAQTTAPDPFKHQITFNIGNTGAGAAELRIYNPAGMLVKTLRPSSINRHALQWDGNDGAGNLVRPGIYTYIVRAAGSESPVMIRKL